jgi:hypothetical protein
MVKLELWSFHTVESKEVASLSGRWITLVVIAMTGILSYASFGIYFWEH